MLAAFGVCTMPRHIEHMQEGRACSAGVRRVSGGDICKDLRSLTEARGSAAHSAGSSAESRDFAWHIGETEGQLAEGDSAEEKSMEHGGVQIEQSLGHRGEAFGLYWGKDGSQEKVLSQERP